MRDRRALIAAEDVEYLAAQAKQVNKGDQDAELITGFRELAFNESESFDRELHTFFVFRDNLRRFVVKEEDITTDNFLSTYDQVCTALGQDGVARQLKEKRSQMVSLLQRIKDFGGGGRNLIEQLAQYQIYLESRMTENQEQDPKKELADDLKDFYIDWLKKEYGDDDFRNLTEENLVLERDLLLRPQNELAVLRRRERSTKGLQFAGDYYPTVDVSSVDDISGQLEKQHQVFGKYKKYFDRLQNETMVLLANEKFDDLDKKDSIIRELQDAGYHVIILEKKQREILDRYQRFLEVHYNTLPIVEPNDEFYKYNYNQQRALIEAVEKEGFRVNEDLSKIDFPGGLMVDPVTRLNPELRKQFTGKELEEILLGAEKEKGVLVDSKSIEELSKDNSTAKLEDEFSKDIFSHINLLDDTEFDLILKYYLKIFSGQLSEDQIRTRFESLREDQLQKKMQELEHGPIPTEIVEVVYNDPVHMADDLQRLVEKEWSADWHKKTPLAYVFYRRKKQFVDFAFEGLKGIAKSCLISAAQEDVKSLTKVIAAIEMVGRYYKSSSPISKNELDILLQPLGEGYGQLKDFFSGYWNLSNARPKYKEVISQSRSDLVSETGDNICFSSVHPEGVLTLERDDSLVMNGKLIMNGKFEIGQMPLARRFELSTSNGRPPYELQVKRDGVFIIDNVRARILSDGGEFIDFLRV